MSRISIGAVLAIILGAHAGATAAARTRAPAPTSEPAIVAAENFYGDVARQIAGPRANVTSILTNPDADPHLFEASASIARRVARARIVVYNGIGYDPWMSKLLAASPSAGRKTIDVAALLGKKPGANPHIWYDPATMPAFAAALAFILEADNPRQAATYRRRLARFRSSLAPIAAHIARLRKIAAGRPATATEPVFGYMFAALGMPVRNRRFQLAMMNNVEPSALDVARFETDLRKRKVALLVYNSQASDPVARHLKKLARAAHVPVVAASETEPPGLTYQQWMTQELDAVGRALGGAP